VGESVDCADNEEGKLTLPEDPGVGEDGCESEQGQRLMKRGERKGRSCSRLPSKMTEVHPTSKGE
jgi:hypothetical protein